MCTGNLLAFQIKYTSSQTVSLHLVHKSISIQGIEEGEAW